ncbi:hypothetical protein M501DRAFT_976282 [Patellaria atrata CBS 101060]|uniref:Utp8 beta-propeller domain-containing protein n=1 Tax=Patellaria atrata CBS 101060 TaxID=1346257 RepID=A0A9P4S8W5_9PEZI|nr:hypothetical protein M501DRAFT_976282 [Patellaria atrata CBS 101060]
MSAGREIDRPHTLFSLPRPVDSTNGRISASRVLSLASLRKRKRSELAVNIDGDGINIYNIQTPRLITSYAIPPQTYFTAPVCSILRKKINGSSARRYTYASIIESRQGKLPQIVCFTEPAQRISVSAPQKWVHQLAQSSKIVAIEVIPNPSVCEVENDSHDVLLVYSDGTLECLSADLQTERWKGYLNDGNVGTEEARVVEFSELFSADTARKGILKERDDILAALETPSNGQSDVLQTTQLLFLLCRTNVAQSLDRNVLTAHLIAIQSRFGTLPSPRAPKKLLWSFAIPLAQDIEGSPVTKPEYSLQPSAGTLRVLQSGKLITYDISATIPSISSDFKPLGFSPESHLQLSSSLYMFISSDSCAIYDMKYMSEQVVTSLNMDPELVLQSKKRKAMGDTARYSSFQLLTYLHDMGMVIAIADQELIGLQLSPSMVPSKKNKNSQSLLINSMFKGKNSLERSVLTSSFRKHVVLETNNDQHSQWNVRVPLLDQHASEDNVEAFEELFVKEVQVKLKTARYIAAKKIADPVRRGQEFKRLKKQEKQSKEDGPLYWDFGSQHSNYGQSRHEHKALYALRKIFRISPFTDGLSATASSGRHQYKLTIQFLPPNVFQWLAITGSLRHELIEKALRQESTLWNSSYNLSAGDIVSAIVSYDPEMRLLHNILTLDPAPRLDIIEIVEAIKLLINSLDAVPFPPLNRYFLTNGETEVDGDEDTQLRHEEEAAMHDLEVANSTLEEGLGIRSRTLLHCFTRLNAFTPPLITQSLRSKLTQHEIFFLIQMLRIELADGGWTAQYTDKGPQIAEGGGPSDRSIGIIANLLGCALDAIGVGGWLVAGIQNPDDTPEDLLQSLRAEISATLEGIHEVVFLRGILNDFMKYGTKVQKSRGKGGDPGKRIIQAVRPADSEYDRILPLGYKVEEWIADTKVGKMGEIRKRSQRDIGQEISRRVGKYSLERILI